MLRGIGKGATDPINHFSFAQFLPAVKLPVDMLVPTVFTISTLRGSSGMVATIIFSLVYGHFTAALWHVQRPSSYFDSLHQQVEFEGSTSASLTYHA